MLVLWLLFYLHQGSAGGRNAVPSLGHPHPASSTGGEGLLDTAHHVSPSCCTLWNAFPAWPSVLPYKRLTHTIAKLFRTWAVCQSGPGCKTAVKLCTKIREKVALNCLGGYVSKEGPQPPEQCEKPQHIYKTRPWTSLSSVTGAVCRPQMKQDRKVQSALFCPRPGNFYPSIRRWLHFFRSSSAIYF